MDLVRARLQEYAPGQVITSSISRAPGRRRGRVCFRAACRSQPGQRHEAQQQNSVRCHAEQSIAGVPRDAREPPHLGTVEIALLHARRHDGISLLLLFRDIGIEPPLVLRDRRWPLPPITGSNWAPSQRSAARIEPPKPSGTSRRQVRFRHFAGCRRILFRSASCSQSNAPLAQDELQSGLVAVLAVAVLVEDADDRFDAVDQALLGQEVVEQARRVGQRPEAAADDDPEAAAGKAVLREPPRGRRCR